MSKEAIERMLTDKRNAYYIYWHNEEHIKDYEEARHVETEEEKENNEFWQQLQESIIYRDRKERAKREANEEYEKYLLQKIRENMEREEDTSVYSWNIITCEKKRVDVMFVEPYSFSDFDFLTLLSKSDQKFIKRWMEAN